MGGGDGHGVGARRGAAQQGRAGGRHRVSCCFVRACVWLWGVVGLLGCLFAPNTDGPGVSVAAAVKQRAKPDSVDEDEDEDEFESDT